MYDINVLIAALVLSYPQRKRRRCSEEQSLLSFRGLGSSSGGGGGGGGGGGSHHVTFREATAGEESKITFTVIRTICGAP